MKELSEAAKQKRREYKREWNRRNRERCAEHTRQYWERKAAQDSKGAVS